MPVIPAKKFDIDSLSNVLGKEDFGSGANHYLTSLYELALARGVDANILLQGIGLNHAMLEQPDLRIPTEKLATFQKAIWDWLNDESMGVCNRKMPSGTYFMMGKLTINQANLGKALQLGARFYNLMLQDKFIELDVQKEQVVLRVCLAQLQQDFKHLFAEICLLAWHRYASWFIAETLPLIEVRFPYSPPAHVEEYNYLYPGKHRFSSGELALVFPTNYLSKICKQNESTLKVFMSRCPVELFKQYKGDYSLASELKTLIKGCLDSGLATIEHCAEKLHMTTRTLMRKLKEEGTSFQQIKDLVRRDRAIHLLSQKTIAINEVAARVGYSDPAVFTRAFRQWTGEAPRNFRNKLDFDNN